MIDRCRGVLLVAAAAYLALLPSGVLSFWRSLAFAVAAVMAVGAVWMGGNQILVGFALFILVPGVANFLYVQIGWTSGSPALDTIAVPLLSQIPVIGERLYSVLPTFVTQGMGVSFYFGGTSLLIIVGVSMDTVQQIESQLIMRHYDGFMKKTRIRGRRGQ